MYFDCVVVPLWFEKKTYKYTNIKINKYKHVSDVISGEINRTQISINVYKFLCQNLLQIII